MGGKKAGGGLAAGTLRKRLVQVRACERAGESLKAYAARHGISVHSLYQAKKEARQQGLLPPHGAEKGRPRTVEPAPAVPVCRGDLGAGNATARLFVAASIFQRRGTREQHSSGR